MRVRSALAFLQLLALLSFAASGSQPFLNSLAVLFRARPPWPTTFPSSKMTPIPPPFISTANSQQGILVAHPINPSSSSSTFDGGFEAGNNKKPNSIGEALTQSLAQPMPTSIPTMPPSLIPIFPQPLPIQFQNGLAGAAERAKALRIRPPPEHGNGLGRFSPLDQGKGLFSSAEQAKGSGLFSSSEHSKGHGFLPTMDQSNGILHPHDQARGILHPHDQARGIVHQGKASGGSIQVIPADNLNILPSQPDSVNPFRVIPSPVDNTGSHYAKPSPPLPPRQPTLVTAPTSIVSSFSIPDAPTTSTHSNAHYNLPVDGGSTVGNSRKKFRQHHHSKQHEGGPRRHPAWSPLTSTVQAAYSTNNNNYNDSYHNANSLQNPAFYESSRKQKKLKGFRPSPQLNSFVETTVITDYATHMNSNNDAGVQNGNGDLSQPPTQPKYESGFRPITFNQYAPNYGTTATRPHYTNSHSQYFNPWSLAYDGSTNDNNQSLETTVESNISTNSKSSSGSLENIELSLEASKDEGKPSRQDRKIYGASSSLVSSHEVIHSDEGRMSSSSSHEFDDGGGTAEQIYIGNRGKMKSSEELLRNGKSRHRFSPSASSPSSLATKGKKQVGLGATISSTTASSELVEEWLPPGIRIENKSDGRKKYPTYNKHIRRAHHHNGGNNNKPMGLKGLMKLPDKCEKFNRFGFCPVTRQYPLEAAEKIASRCSALLSHLIAPFPKMDVQYDISGDPKNRSTAGGRRKSPSGWAWKSYMGKPVCDTDELTTVPGWARNENGDWLIILQTKAYQQKAHISLCSPNAAHCQGLSCANSKEKKGSGQAKGDTPKDTKCVQRFTAQRLAVFDPENPDRCPVVRSVFLPSACVCLTNKGMPGPSAQSREGGPDGNYSTSAGRQALFSSSKEIGGGEGEDEDEPVRVFPPDSAEAFLQTQQGSSGSFERSRQTGGRRRRPVYSFSSSSSSAEARNSNELPQPSVLFNPQDPHNSTFMIITEKFTTKESSKEEILPPHTVRVVHDTTSTVRISPR